MIQYYTASKIIYDKCDFKIKKSQNTYLFYLLLKHMQYKPYSFVDTSAFGKIIKKVMINDYIKFITLDTPGK